jgi:hypothetical protein
VTYYSAEHPDLLLNQAAIKRITCGGRQAIEDKAIAAYTRAFEEEGREAAEEVYFSFFNKTQNGTGSNTVDINKGRTA